VENAKRSKTSQRQVKPAEGGRQKHGFKDFAEYEIVAAIFPGDDGDGSADKGFMDRKWPSKIERERRQDNSEQRKKNCRSLNAALKAAQSIHFRPTSSRTEILRSRSM
jgi:hypothetical protein